MKRPELAYALVQCADGRWLVLNRDYKPFRQHLRRHRRVDYDKCTGIRVRLSDDQLRKLDGGNASYQAGDCMLWLYHDATPPDQGGASKVAYQQRLAVLSEAQEGVA